MKRLEIISCGDPNPNGFHLSTNERPNIDIIKTNAGSKKANIVADEIKNMTVSSVDLGFLHKIRFLKDSEKVS